MSSVRSHPAVDEAAIAEATPKGGRRAALAAEVADIIDVIDPGSKSPKRTAAPAAGWSPDALLRNFRFDGASIPAIVAGAAPLLRLAHALRYRSDPPDIEALRTTTIAAIKTYERDLAGARIAADRARAAHYVVCATIDDVVLSQPWGVRSGWARSGLVSTFHLDVTGGERVFDLLEHFHRNPGANKDILLLIYLCLSLGFEGRTRVAPRGTLELDRIRDGLYRTLKGQFGAFERELSPHWRGLAARHVPLKTATTLWALAGAFLLFFALGYLVLTLMLNGASDATLARFAAAVPREAPSLAAIEHPEPEVPAVAEMPEPPVARAPAVPDAPVEPSPATVPPPDPLDTFAAFLQPEVDAGLVSLTRENGAVLVRIRNTGLFGSGSAETNPEFHDLLNRIGGAIASENFKAVVIGHTDDRPIRTVQFPSNWHLSEARARNVAEIVASYAGTEVVSYEGRADTEPVADNATPDGREANRRTEILVLGATAQAGFRSRLPRGAAAEPAAIPPAPDDSGGGE